MRGNRRRHTSRKVCELKCRCYCRAISPDNYTSQEVCELKLILRISRNNLNSHTSQEAYELKYIFIDLSPAQCCHISQEVCELKLYVWKLFKNSEVTSRKRCVSWNRRYGSCQNRYCHVSQGVYELKNTRITVDAMPAMSHLTRGVWVEISQPPATRKGNCHIPQEVCELKFAWNYTK